MRPSGGLANVVKDQFDQTMSALSPFLTAPPQFPTSPPDVTNLPLVADERRGQNVLLRADQLRLWLERSVQRGVRPNSEEQFGDRRLWRRWTSSGLVTVVEQPSPERQKRGHPWCWTLHSDHEVSSLPLNVYVRLGAWSWYVGSSFFPGAVSGASEREQTWTLCDCFAELLEFACVESEGSVLPLVSLATPWAFDGVHK